MCFLKLHKSLKLQLQHLVQHPVLIARNTTQPQNFESSRLFSRGHLILLHRHSIEKLSILVLFFTPPYDVLSALELCSVIPETLTFLSLSKFVFV